MHLVRIVVFDLLQHFSKWKRGETILAIVLGQDATLEQTKWLVKHVYFANKRTTNVFQFCRLCVHMWDGKKTNL